MKATGFGRASIYCYPVNRKLTGCKGQTNLGSSVYLESIQTTLSSSMLPVGCRLHPSSFEVEEKVA